MAAADDRLGIARLQRRLAERAELGHKHRNERVPHDIVRERELLRHLLPEVLEVRWDDRKFLQRIFPQPSGEVRLDGDVAWLADFGHFAVDAYEPLGEINVLRFEPEDFAGAQARPDAGEQAQSEEGHGGGVMRLDVSHERRCLPCVEGDSAAAPAANATGRDFGESVVGNPFPLEAEFEEGRDNPTPIIERLVRRSARLEISEQPGRRQFGHGRTGKVFFQPVEVAFYSCQIRLGNQVLFALMVLEDEKFCDGLRQESLSYRLPVVRQRELHVEGQRPGMVGQPAEHGLRFMELILRQAGDRGPDAGFALETLDLHNLALGFGLGTSPKVFTNAFAVQPAGNAENELPGGIRE